MNKLPLPEKKCRSCKASLFSQAIFEEVVVEDGVLSQKWSCRICKSSYKAYFRFWDIYEQD